MSPEPVLTFGSAASLIWALIFGVGVTAPFLSSLRGFFRYRARLRAEAATAQRPQRLSAGPTTLRGCVEASGEEDPITIAIDQIGSNRKGGGREHEWSEVKRDVRLQSFRLRLDGGECINVIADRDVRLRAPLRTAHFEGYRRLRLASLRGGERVWLRGQLSTVAGEKAGVRALGAWQMRGDASCPLEISVGELTATTHYWTNRHRRAALLLALPMLAVFGALFSFYALLLFGRVELATFTKADTYDTRDKSGTVHHYVVHARLDGGVALHDEVDARSCRAAMEGRLQHVRFVYVPVFPALHAVGTHARLSHARFLLAFLATLGALGMFSWLLSAPRNTPWYEQQVVAERGLGSLEQSAWRVQDPGPGQFYTDYDPWRD